MAQSSDALPGVSYVMPVLNEVEHIEAAIEALFAQDYGGEFDVVLALGPSVDGTNAIVRSMAKADPRIHSVPNKVGSTPAGLNAAIRASKHPIVIRVDAHSVLPANYTRIAVATLLATGADNVGGIMRARGVTAFQKAVAHAYGSPEGLGGTQHHVGGRAGPADTAYLGVFLRHRLLEVGLFDEDIKRGQDWELNRRLRGSGGVVWFTPELEVAYRPRSSLQKLIRQFVATGIWRGELARRFGSANALRYFVPPVAVIGIVLGLILGGIGLAIQSPWFIAAFVVPASYALLVVIASVRASREGVLVGLWYLAVLPCIHFGWGSGFILGYFGLTKNLVDFTGR